MANCGLTDAVELKGANYEPTLGKWFTLTWILGLLILCSIFWMDCSLDLEIDW